MQGAWLAKSYFLTRSHEGTKRLIIFVASWLRVKSMYYLRCARVPGRCGAVCQSALPFTAPPLHHPLRGRSPSPNRGGSWWSAEFGDGEAVGLGAVFHGSLGAGEGLGDGFEAHAFLGEGVELLEFGGRPGLAVTFEFFGHGRG